jgi:hypothetical protein
MRGATACDLVEIERALRQLSELRVVQQVRYKAGYIGKSSVEQRGLEARFAWQEQMRHDDEGLQGHRQ